MKAIDTNQYLNFWSHHPLYHKLGDVRSLLDRKDTIVSDPAEQTANLSLSQSVSYMNSTNCTVSEWLGVSMPILRAEYGQNSG